MEFRSGKYLISESKGYWGMKALEGNFKIKAEVTVYDTPDNKEVIEEFFVTGFNKDYINDICRFGSDEEKALAFFVRDCGVYELEDESPVEILADFSMLNEKYSTMTEEDLPAEETARKERIRKSQEEFDTTGDCVELRQDAVYRYLVAPSAYYSNELVEYTQNRVNSSFNTKNYSFDE